VPWDAIHHQVSISRWLFDDPHPAATVVTPNKRKRRVDLALLKSEEFLAADLPATKPGFQFDAFLEFKYLDDYWTVEGARVFNDPDKGKDEVQEDVDKINLHLEGRACRVGYVVVFEECDWGFAPTFASESEARHGCRVRFIRGYAPAA
jgi:hypothetical protein